MQIFTFYFESRKQLKGIKLPDRKEFFAQNKLSFKDQFINRVFQR